MKRTHTLNLWMGKVPRPSTTRNAAEPYRTAITSKSFWWLSLENNFSWTLTLGLPSRNRALSIFYEKYGNSRVTHRINAPRGASFRQRDTVMLLQAESDRSCTFSRASGHSGRRGSSPGSHLLHLPLPAPGSPTCGGAQPGFKGLKTLQPAPHVPRTSPPQDLPQGALQTTPAAPRGWGWACFFPQNALYFFFSPRLPSARAHPAPDPSRLWTPGAVLGSPAGQRPPPATGRLHLSPLTPHSPPPSPRRRRRRRGSPSSPHQRPRRGRGDGTGQDTGSAASSLPPQAPPEASRRAGAARGGQVGAARRGRRAL